MTVGDLKRCLEYFGDEEMVYFRPRINPCGNINDLFYAIHGHVSFFGVVEPCCILDNQESINPNEVAVRMQGFEGMAAEQMPAADRIIKKRT